MAKVPPLTTKLPPKEKGDNSPKEQDDTEAHRQDHDVTAETPSQTKPKSKLSSPNAFGRRCPTIQICARRATFLDSAALLARCAQAAMSTLYAPNARAKKCALLAVRARKGTAPPKTHVMAAKPNSKECVAFTKRKTRDYQPGSQRRRHLQVQGYTALQVHWQRQR